MRKWHFLDQPISSYPTAAPAEPQGFRHRARGTGPHGSSRIERQYEVGCVGQRLLEHCSDAIGGDHIKPHARTDNDSGGLGIRVAVLRGEKNFYFAGDIEIMGLVL